MRNILQSDVTPRAVLRARYTSPLPPAPRAVLISCGPSFVTGERGMNVRDYNLRNARQFIALTKNVPAGILLSAAAFGAAHAYQGFRMVILIGL